MTIPLPVRIVLLLVLPVASQAGVVELYVAGARDATRKLKSQGPLTRTTPSATTSSSTA